MKHLIYLAVLLVLTTSTWIAQAGGQEIRMCEFEVKARCFSGEARVTLADGVVKRVEIDVDWCGLPGKLGYSCTINSSRSDRDSIWSEDGDATLIANASPFNPKRPDRVRVTVGRLGCRALFLLKLSYAGLCDSQGVLTADAEVSRGHILGQAVGKASEALQSRKAEKQIGRAGN